MATMKRVTFLTAISLLVMTYIANDPAMAACNATVNGLPMSPAPADSNVGCSGL